MSTTRASAIGTKAAPTAAVVGAVVTGITDDTVAGVLWLVAIAEVNWVTDDSWLRLVVVIVGGAVNAGIVQENNPNAKATGRRIPQSRDQIMIQSQILPVTLTI